MTSIRKDTNLRMRQYYRKNRKKVLQRSKNYYKNNKAHVLRRNKKLWMSKPLAERRIISRRIQVKCTFKLTPGQHDSLLKKQSYRCPISGMPVDIFSAIDHDRKCCPGDKSCGRCIRGILHKSINSALGFFKDNRTWLLKARRYLKRKV